MPIYSISDLQPIYEDTYDKIKPSNIDNYPKVAATIYWIMQIDGEIKNGGVAQLIWNLKEKYDYKHLYSALERIGSEKGKKIVKKAVDYIYKTEKRKEAFFAKGPFGAAKPLQDLSDYYYNLSPSVSAQLLTYVEEQWSDKDLKKLVKKLQLEDILKITFTNEQVFEAIREANLKLLESMIAAGLDVNIQDRHGKNLIMQCFDYSNKTKARVEIVKRLAEAGTLIDTEERGALNSITYYGGQPEYVTCLVELGAEIERAEIRGRTTVFDLVKKHKNLQYFIDLGVNIHYKTADGYTPLGYALAELGRWIDDKEHAFRHEYIPELEASINILLQHGATLSETPNKETVIWVERTELSYVTGDLKLLKLLSKEASFKKIPEFTKAKGVWSAMHQASKDGNIASLKFLLEQGISPNLILEKEDLGKDVFAGTTPLDLAKDEPTAALLTKYKAEKGIPLYHALYLKTRGSKTEALTTLVSKIQKISLEEASQLVQNLPKEEGNTLEWDENDNIIRYKELLLATFADREAAQGLLEELQTLDVITKLL